MSMARSHKTYFALVLSALAVAALAPAGCGSDEDDDGNGGSGASGSTDNSGAAGATGGATGSGGSGGDPNVDCPEDPGADACQQCAQDNCEAEVTACCDQDDAAAAMGDKGCYDVVECARESACSGTDCLTVCEGDIGEAGADVAFEFAQPLGDCVIAAVDAGLCPECAPPGGGGAGGGGGGG
jgi:hypothetical protein